MRNKLHGFPWSFKINTKLSLKQSTVTLPSNQATEPKGSGFMSSQIMTPAEARRDTKNLFHEMSVFALQNITDLKEEDGSVNSKVKGVYLYGYKPSDPIRAGNLSITTVLINTCCWNLLFSVRSCPPFLIFSCLLLTSHVPALYVVPALQLSKDSL